MGDVQKSHSQSADHAVLFMWILAFITVPLTIWRPELTLPLVGVGVGLVIMMFYHLMQLFPIRKE